MFEYEFELKVLIDHPIFWIRGNSLMAKLPGDNVDGVSVKIGKRVHVHGDFVTVSVHSDYGFWFRHNMPANSID